MQPVEAVTGLEIARPQVAASVPEIAAHFPVAAPVQARRAPAVRAALPAWERAAAAVVFVAVADVEAGEGDRPVTAADFARYKLLNIKY